ncbi:hypothetical protein QJQ45_018709, partial [Haematococcus lacustris]
RPHGKLKVSIKAAWVKNLHLDPDAMTEVTEGTEVTEQSGASTSRKAHHHQHQAPDRAEADEQDLSGFDPEQADDAAAGAQPQSEQRPGSGRSKKQKQRRVRDHHIPDEIPEDYDLPVDPEEVERIKSEQEHQDPAAALAQYKQRSQAKLQGQAPEAPGHRLQTASWKDYVCCCCGPRFQPLDGQEEATLLADKQASHVEPQGGEAAPKKKKKKKRSKSSREVQLGSIQGDGVPADQGRGQHLAAASSALEANAVWEVYRDPMCARQRLRLYGAQDRALERLFKKLEEDMAEVSMQRHERPKQLVVFFGAASIGTRGGWGADAVLQACCKVRIGESRWRPWELCWWPEQGKLPAKGKDYPGLGYKRLRDKPPKAHQQQQQQQQQQPVVAHGRAQMEALMRDEGLVVKFSVTVICKCDKGYNVAVASEYHRRRVVATMLSSQRASGVTQISRRTLSSFACHPVMRRAAGESISYQEPSVEKVSEKGAIP